MDREFIHCNLFDKIKKEMIFMKMKVPLSTIIVGNLNPSIKSNIIFNITNNSGKISVHNSGEPDYINEFMIELEDFGYGTTNNYYEPNALIIFILSCSLATENVLFAMKKLSEDLKPSPIEETVQNSNYTIIGPAEIICHLKPIRFEKLKVEATVKTEIDLNEEEIIGHGRILLDFGIFESKTSTYDENIKEAIDEYLVALETHEARSCYNQLYKALEKTVNADRDTTGNKFDLKASNLTGIEESQIKRLRKCHDRMKHSQRNPEDINEINDCISKISEALFTLKKATDTAILKRLQNL